MWSLPYFNASHIDIKASEVFSKGSFIDYYPASDKNGTQNGTKQKDLTENQSVRSYLVAGAGIAKGIYYASVIEIHHIKYMIFK